MCKSHNSLCDWAIRVSGWVDAWQNSFPPGIHDNKHYCTRVCQFASCLFVASFWCSDWKHCGCDVIACCIVSSEQHVTCCACRALKFPMSFRQAVCLLPYFVTLPFVPYSPNRDIRRKGSVLPRSGFGSGSVILLPSHPQEHHQTDLLL